MKEPKSKKRNYQITHELAKELDKLRAKITLIEDNKISLEELMARFIKNESERLDNKNEK